MLPPPDFEDRVVFGSHLGQGGRWSSRRIRCARPSKGIEASQLPLTPEPTLSDPSLSQTLWQHLTLAFELPGRAIVSPDLWKFAILIVISVTIALLVHFLSRAYPRFWLWRFLRPKFATRLKFQGSPLGQVIDFLCGFVGREFYYAWLECAETVQGAVLLGMVYAQYARDTYCKIIESVFVDRMPKSTTVTHCAASENEDGQIGLRDLLSEVTISESCSDSESSELDSLC